jgi:release factor glutamine methyltransferase
MSAQPFGDSELTAECTVHEALHWAAQQLVDVDGRAHQQARWLLAEVRGQSSTQLAADMRATLTDAERQRFATLVARRVQGEPLQHVLGHTDFYGLRIQVNSDVLVPRPETEVVVEQGLALIEEVEAPRIFDAGTGSGCIACALKHERPDADVAAGDVSEAALDVARTNGRALGLDVAWQAFDMAASGAAEVVPGSLDLLISNPPYIPDHEADTLSGVVRDYDPPEALFTGPDALRFYRALANWGYKAVRPGGHVLVETHTDGAEAVVRLFQEQGWTDVHQKDDWSGRPRMVWGRRP